MAFFDDWAKDENDGKYLREFLKKTDSSRIVLRNGTEKEVRNACELLKAIPIESFIRAINELSFDRIPTTDEIPQCGKIEKALCEVPQALAFAPEGLLCAELGLRLGAENHGDAPRKSGEGNGKLADAIDVAIRMKLPAESKTGHKYGYRISSLGTYLLRFTTIEEKIDIITRLLAREPIVRYLIVKASEGYASYDEAVSSLKSAVTRMRRRQNVRRIMAFIDSQITDGTLYCDLIDWDVRS